MQYSSSAYASTLWPFPIVGKSGPYTALTQIQAAHLANKLCDDSKHVYFSCLITFADALRGLDQQFYSWSCVKLYYLTSYLFRSYVSLDGIAQFHIGKYPRWCDAKAGDIPHAPPKVAGQLGSETSHKMAFNLFASRNANNILLSQDIDNMRPDDWLQKKREYFNYQQAKFVEPACPSCFAGIAEHGARKMFLEYLKDDSYLYAFDPDHAMLAYPLAALKILRHRFAAAGIKPITADDQKVIQDYWRDHFGPIREIKELI